jgi:predicted transcriptional regulator YheO
MKKELKPYIALCDAIAKLFYPNVEVVMHDLETKKLVHIVNAFSKRRVGDAMISELKDLKSIKENWVGPYDKTGSEGKRLKAVSIIIRDAEEKPIGMICINYNVEPLENLHDFLKNFLHVRTDAKPSVLFSQSWREHTDETIEKYLSSKNIALTGLSSDDKKALVLFLESEGIFAIRNVARYVCEKLGISKATLYNWLKAVRG